MKLDKNFEIRVAVIEELDNGGTGDVDIDFGKFKERHPGSGYFFGFLLVDTRTGLVPDDAPDWYDSIDEAVHGWAAHYKG